MHPILMINLWCESRERDEELDLPRSKHQKMSKREEKESMVDEIVQELKEKSGKSLVPFVGTYDYYWCTF